MSDVEIEVDGLPRTFVVRETVGSPVLDVVDWSVGSGQPGSSAMNWTMAAAGRVDLGPDSLPLPNASIRSWVMPGLPPTDPLYPPDAPNDHTDLNFLAARAAWAQVQWPGSRFWVAGHSKGASVGISAYAFGLSGVQGYWFSCFGTPRLDFYGWDIAAKISDGSLVRAPITLWHGGDVEDDRSQALGGAKSWADSAVDLSTSTGASSFSAWAAEGSCCGLSLEKRYSIGGTKPFVEHKRLLGPHEWTQCPGPTPPTCREGNRALNFFATNGLGT